MTISLLAVIAACGGGSSVGPDSASDVDATYFGGAGGGVANDRAQGCAWVPGSGRVVIVGNTTSDDLPSQYPGKPGWRKQIAGASDAFVAVLESDLSSVVAWTYLGGDAEDRAYGVVVDGQGAIWVSGFTGSTDFPIVGNGTAHNGPSSTWDAFVAKFSGDLKQLTWSTCIGGTSNENPREALAVDSAGNVYVAGQTSSSDFPVQASAGNTLFDASFNGNWDAFVVKIAPSGSILWATFLGGADFDGGWSNACLSADEQSVYVAGFTRSDETVDGFPVTQAFDLTYNGDEGPAEPSSGDCFVARLSSDGRLLNCTYLGGASNDNASPNGGLALASDGRVVVAGQTRSSSTSGAFPVTPNAYDAVHDGPTQGIDGSDVFVAVFDPTLGSLDYCSYFGGAANDDAAGVELDGGGRIHVTGNTDSIDFPTTSDAFEPTYSGKTDAFLIVLDYDSASSTLQYATFVGGRATVGGGFEGDRGRALAVRATDGATLISGDTDVADFPTTPGALSPEYIGGISDAFVTVHRFE